jgi:hypothetical protein
MKQPVKMKEEFTTDFQGHVIKIVPPKLPRGEKSDIRKRVKVLEEATGPQLGDFVRGVKKTPSKVVPLSPSPRSDSPQEKVTQVGLSRKHSLSKLTSPHLSPRNSTTSLNERDDFSAAEFHQNGPESQVNVDKFGDTIESRVEMEQL